MDNKRVKINLLIWAVATSLLWILSARIPGLSGDGIFTLLLTVTAIFWWSFKIMPQFITSMLVLAALLVSGTLSSSETMAFFSSPLLVFLVGSFLLAAAVSQCGLAERFSAIIISLFIPKSSGSLSFARLIVIIYFLNFMLSLAVPLPITRAILLAVIFLKICEKGSFTGKEKKQLMLAVFSSSVVTGVPFLSASPIINNSSLIFASKETLWLEWTLWMTVPGIVLITGYVLIQIFLARSSGLKPVDTDSILSGMKRTTWSSKEKWVLFWLLLTIALWVTEGLHGIGGAWVLIFTVAGLAFPYTGNIIKDGDLGKTVQWSMMFFVAAAVAIGKAMQVTGAAAVITKYILPSVVPDNIYVLVLLIGIGTVVIHMLAGSVITTIAVATPIFLSYTQGSVLPEIAVVLIVNLASQGHFILPFHNAALMVGTEMSYPYDLKDVANLGIGIALFMPLLLLISMFLWRMLGLL